VPADVEDAMPEIRAVRVRRTEKQWTEILRRFESSGLGSRQFCHRNGLALSSLERWRRRLGSIPKAKFVELVAAPADPADAAPASWSLEVCLPNGVSLRFRA
jgi:hypothetical protein